MTEFDGKIGHLEGIESPWGNAGGVVKTVEDVEQMARTGVGWVEAGSYTLEARVGNSPNGERVYYHNPETGETFNSLGMPNRGMDIVETEIPEMARIAHVHNKQLLVNVAPVSDQPKQESHELISRAYAAGADGVILNAGCPNVVTEEGGRHEILSHNMQGFKEVLSYLRPRTDISRPIWVRISPQESYEHTRGILTSVRISGITSAVLTPNTWPGHKPLDVDNNTILEVAGGIGGKSGPAMSEEAALQTYWAEYVLRGSAVDIIRSSSIMNARELQLALDLGAVAGAGTTFFYESRNGWQEDTDRLLSDLASGNS